MASTTIEFRDTEKSLSATLVDFARTIPAGTITLRDLLTQIGEQGLLLICLFLTLPFLIPVSIPGVSTVFGLAVILIGAAVTLNRVPWLPRRLMDRGLSASQLAQALEKGAQIVARFERFVRPRLPRLTEGAVVNRINGLAVVIGGVLLIFPLGLIPFSNTLPALAILFLCLGILERDGLFIVLGHLMNVLTVIYFAALAVGAILAGQGLMSLIGS